MKRDPVLFRPANMQDCYLIARLYSISSDGVADYVWSTLAEPGQDLLDVGRRRYEREDSDFSYRNCTMAEVDGEIAGMLVAFPIHTDPDSEPEKDPVLAPFSKLEEDNSYYICGVALFKDFRGNGIGSQFMQLAELKAKELGLGKTSLIVFEKNKGALRLYERLGYRETARELIVPHPLIHVDGEAILMVKELT